jgi:DNA mismatch endonuclease (patch repair protein)
MPIQCTGRGHPWPNVANATRNVMRGNRGKDTRPEVALRQHLHRLGYRFRVHSRHLPGTPDIVFPARGAAIQVHGCFWHQHPECRWAVRPRTRIEYWLPKLQRNAERDRESADRLQALGWRSMVVWECELSNMQRLSPRLSEFLGAPRPIGTRGKTP